MSDPLDPKRLDALEERLSKHRAPETAPEHDNHIQAAQAGWRMVTELVVGMLLGAGIGYGLDRVLNTLPWMLIIFTSLGFAAGVRTMMRTAEEIQQHNTKLSANATAGPDEMYDDHD